MNKFLTKKNVLIFSSVAVTSLLFLKILGPSKLCSIHGNCLHTFSQTVIYLYPIFATWLSIILLYKMQDNIFHFWINFAKWWLIGTLLLIFLLPDGEGGGWAIPMLPYNKIFALYSSELFFFTSLVLIVWKYIQHRKTK